MVDGMPTVKTERPVEDKRHKIISVVKKRGCEYAFTWDDGYSAVYSAAVQCRYEEGDQDSVTISQDGRIVTFPDGTSMSAELLRVDTMQKTNHAIAIILCFSAVLVAAMVAMLHWKAFSEEFIPIAYVCIAVLTSLTAMSFRRQRMFWATDLGLVLCMAGLALLYKTLALSALLLAAGYIIQFLFLFYIDYRASIGLES